MSKSRTVILTLGAVLLGSLLITVIALHFIDVNAFKPRLEAAASRASGMQVRVEGDMHVGFSPGLSLTLNQVHVQNRGIPLATAQRAKVRIELVSLLKNKPRVQSIALTRVKLSIERDKQGLFNFENTEKPKGIPRALDLTGVTAEDGTILYTDHQSGDKLEAGNCHLRASRLRLSGVSGVDLMKNIDLNATLSCARVLSGKIVITDAKLSVQGAQGQYQLRPVSMQVFSGNGSAEVEADFSGDVPHWKVQYRLNQFRAEQFLETMQPKYAIKGSLDFTATLSASGKTWQALLATAGGEASLRGKELILVGRDLDLELARYDSTQNFNLVDVGALFFAGPIGIVVTKGYDFANLFRGKGGTTPIRELVSQWRVRDGVAEAQDVAIATSENYLALQGGLDFANKRFQHVTVALVDARGCTRIRQKIRGPFRKPVVEKPNIIEAVTGPVRKLLKTTKEAITGRHCEVFYKGALLAPDQPGGGPSS